MTEVLGAGANPPEMDPDSFRFWGGLREEKIFLQRCKLCDQYRFPPLPSCPYCGHPVFAESLACGLGTVYSWVVVHVAFDPAFASEVPYTIGVIDLDEGPRIPARIIPGSSPVTAGVRVGAHFEHHDRWTELRFRAVS